ncbi:MAG: GAF domain-containing protein [Ghiorsea sp.]|nr:GAF domain-containing protein [Ghiorsea sp.]
MVDNLSTPPKKYNVLRLYLLLAACLVIAGMIYIMQLSGHISRVHTQASNTAEHITGDLSIAHLWLEEITTNKTSAKPELIFTRLQHVQRDLQALRHLDQHSHTFFSHPEIDHLSLVHHKVEETFTHLLSMTKQRLSQPDTSGIGTPIEQQYDDAYSQFITDINEIKSRLQSAHEKHLSNLENTQLTLIILSFFIMLVMIRVSVQTLKQQRADYENRLESENRFNKLVEQSPLSTQLMQTDGTIIQVNQAWEKLWGVKLKALEGYNILQDQQLKDKGIMTYIERGFAGEALALPTINFNPEDTPNIKAPANHQFVRAHIYPLRNTSGEVYQVVLFHEDVTEGYLQNLFQVGQSNILKRIADPDVPLADVLAKLVLFIEDISPNMFGSILLLDENGTHLHDAAGPHLPAAYRDTVNGLEIGPDAGSCGTAAYTGKRVIVSDIASNPLWANFKELASEYGLCACWSQPIYDSSGKVLGTFAMYYQEPHEPQDLDIRLISDAAQLAAHAILHKQSIQKSLNLKLCL